MRVAGTSNFGDETFSEHFVTDVDEWNDERMQEWCDEHNSDYNPVYYKLVPSDYKLFIWRP